MRRNLLTGLLLSACACVAFAGGRGGFSGGGGGARFESAAPAGSGSFRPSGGGEAPHSFSQPAFEAGRAPISRPPPPPPAQVIQRPVAVNPRPAQVSPGSAGALPSFSAQHFPAQQGAGTNDRHEIDRPAGLPAQNPAQGADFLGMRPEHGGNRQSIQNHSIPPGNAGVVARPASPSIPVTRAAGSAAGRPVLPNPPGKIARPARPQLPDRWQNVSNGFANHFDHWRQTNAASIATFQNNRTELWNRVQTRGNDRNWPRQFHSDAYHQWRQDVWSYRKDRAAEIWDRTRDLHENLFDDHWWNTCWWRRNPRAVAVNASPWWWWNTASWSDDCAFFGSTLSPDPVVYDPGTTAIYDGDEFIVDGQDDGSASAARDQAIALAGPAVDQVPVPDPPADGQPQTWLSLGAWALTQQEQGDAVMFFQISVDKDGIIAGGYKNALTGEEQPIVGRLDRRTQRVAWHINSAPQTVFETGLSNLSYDVASVFVHFGEMQTQTWLLVRLPSPETPPEAVKIPQG